MLLRWSSHLASGKPLGHLEGEQPGTGLTNHGYLGSGFMVFVVHPCLGKIPIFTSIFQTGWFNQQLSIVINHETSKSWEPILQVVGPRREAGFPMSRDQVAAAVTGAFASYLHLSRSRWLKKRYKMPWNRDAACLVDHKNLVNCYMIYVCRLEAI